MNKYLMSTITIFSVPAIGIMMILAIAASIDLATIYGIPYLPYITLGVGMINLFVFMFLVVNVPHNRDGENNNPEDEG